MRMFQTHAIEQSFGADPSPNQFRKTVNFGVKDQRLI